MASFTYTIWSDLLIPALMNQLQVVFDQLSFSLTNPRSGKIHFWTPEENEIDPTALQSIMGMELPLGLQWWRGEDDIVRLKEISKQDLRKVVPTRLSLLGNNPCKGGSFRRQATCCLKPRLHRSDDDRTVVQNVSRELQRSWGSFA